MSFASVGGVGFAVDAGLLMFIHETLDVNVYAARLLSFLVAVTVTWWLNRYVTFADVTSVSRIREWRRYLAVSSVGFTVNLGVFYLFVLNSEMFRRWPLAALALASLVAMFFNFWASRRYAFVGKS